jgi:hypothetical protein
VTAAEQQLGEQEVDEDHRCHAAGFAHQRHPDHEQEHVRQILDLREVGPGNRVDQRPDELVADDVVVDLEQDAEGRDDQDVLGGLPRPAVRAHGGPKDDADADDAYGPDSPVVEGIPSRRQPDGGVRGD